VEQVKAVTYDKEKAKGSLENVCFDRLRENEITWINVI
jgi:hypothetical protein